MELPQIYLDNMKELLNDEYQDYLDSFNNDRVYSLRVNTNKISVQDFLNIVPFKLEAIPWTSDGFYFDPNDNVTKHPYYYAGLYYIQEASAMLPAEVLPIEENDIVLDACAAPGGKSSKIANKLNGSGLLIANDISVSRAQVLLKTLESQGIKNAYVMAEDINNLNMENYFDKILLDAPCSGEGMFRKDPELIKSWQIKNNDYYSNIQKQIITKALSLLKEGGQLVYSTCTFSKKENEEVIEYALSICPELKVLPIKKYEGFSSGLTDKTKDCIRLFPHKIKGEGHFVALLQKGNNSNKTNRIYNNKCKLEDNDFFKHLNLDTSNYELININNKLYLKPNIDINTPHLRILRSGLFLGEYKHDKFEPSEALALALKANEYDNILNLDINDNRVIKYLKCETLDVKDFNVEGLVLVCVNNYPLGFGKVNGGILKNKYPANYRYK